MALLHRKSDKLAPGEDRISLGTSLPPGSYEVRQQRWGYAESTPPNFGPRRRAEVFVGRFEVLPVEFSTACPQSLVQIISKMLDADGNSVPLAFQGVTLGVFNIFTQQAATLYHDVRCELYIPMGLALPGASGAMALPIIVYTHGVLCPPSPGGKACSVATENSSAYDGVETRRLLSCIAARGYYVLSVDTQGVPAPPGIINSAYNADATPYMRGVVMRAVLKALRERWPWLAQGRGVGFMGHSQGARAALFALSDQWCPLTPIEGAWGPGRAAVNVAPAADLGGVIAEAPAIEAPGASALIFAPTADEDVGYIDFATNYGHLGSSLAYKALINVECATHWGAVHRPPQGQKFACCFGAFAESFNSFDDPPSCVPGYEDQFALLQHSTSSFFDATLKGKVAQNPWLRGAVTWSGAPYTLRLSLAAEYVVTETPSLLIGNADLGSQRWGSITAWGYHVGTEQAEFLGTELLDTKHRVYPDGSVSARKALGVSLQEDIPQQIAIFKLPNSGTFPHETVIRFDCAALPHWIHSIEQEYDQPLTFSVGLWRQSTGGSEYFWREVAVSLPTQIKAQGASSATKAWMRTVRVPVATLAGMTQSIMEGEDVEREVLFWFGTSPDGSPLARRGALLLAAPRLSLS